MLQGAWIYLLHIDRLLGDIGELQTRTVGENGSHGQLLRNPLAVFIKTVNSRPNPEFDQIENDIHIRQQDRLISITIDLYRF
jgi:hypothetical protein